MDTGAAMCARAVRISKKSHNSPKTALVFTTTPLSWFSCLTATPCPDTYHDPLSYDSHLSRHLSQSPVAKQHVSFHLSP